MSDDALIRLQNLRQLGLTATELSERMGTRYTYWRDMLAGQKSFGEKAARNLEERLGLMRGCLDSPDGCEGVVIRADDAHRPQAAGRSIEIPQFDTGGAMGNGLVLRDQPGVIRSISVSPEWLQKNVRSHTGAQNLRIVTGFGDSMRPLFDPGDPLLVDTGVKYVEIDSVFFFRVGEEGFIKRLQRIPGVGIRVISANKEYEPWTITKDMDFEVFGHVLRAWKGEYF